MSDFIMVQFVLLLLALLGVNLFLTKKYVPFLLVATFIVFNGFGLLGPSTERTNLDAYTFMSFAILGIQVLGNSIRKNKCEEKKKVGGAIILLLVYISLRTLISVLIGEETALYSLKVVRTDFFWLSFFLFMQIDNVSMQKYLQKLYIIFSVVGVIYVISFLSWIRTTGDEEMINLNAIITMSAPLLLLMLFEESTKKYKLLYIVLFSVFLLASFSRGVLLAFGVAIGYYYIIIQKKKHALLSLFLILPLFYLLFSIVDRNKASNVSNMSTMEEIQYASSLDSYQDFQFGSFGLRIAMIWERADYLIEQPGELWWGIGSIHEDSPNNKFSFMVGSYKTIDNNRSRQMIDTDDVAILSHWFRYGTIWLILFVYFLVVSFKECKKHRKRPYVIVAELTLIIACIASFSNDFFSELHFMFLPLLLLSRIYAPEANVESIINRHK